MDAGAAQEMGQLFERLSMTVPRGWSWVVELFRERLKTIDRTDGELKPLRKAVENVAALAPATVNNSNVESDSMIAFNARVGSLLEGLVVDLLAELPSSRVLDLGRDLQIWVESVNRGYALRRATEEQVAIASRDALIRDKGSKLHPADIIRLSEEQGARLSLGEGDAIVATPGGRLSYDCRIWVDLKRAEIVEHLKARTVGEAV